MTDETATLKDIARLLSVISKQLAAIQKAISSDEVATVSSEGKVATIKVTRRINA